MSIEGHVLFGKEKRLNNCYQQLLRRISSDVVYILKWLEYYATIRGENQDTKVVTVFCYPKKCHASAHGEEWQKQSEHGIISP